MPFTNVTAAKGHQSAHHDEVRRLLEEDEDIVVYETPDGGWRATVNVDNVQERLEYLPGSWGVTVDRREQGFNTTEHAIIIKRGDRVLLKFE